MELIAGAVLVLGSIVAAFLIGQRRPHSPSPSLDARVAELERGQDVWRTQLAAMADAAEDILKRAERRLKRAEAVERYDQAKDDAATPNGVGVGGGDAEREAYRQHQKLVALGRR